MQTDLRERAIKQALLQNWDEAIKVNHELLETKPEDIEALNRLAFAYLKSGNLPSCKMTYKKVLKLDKYNPIAMKNLLWLSKINNADLQKNITISPSPTIFLEEPGKTKLVTLVHAAPTKILCNLLTAQKVMLVAKKHSVEIRDTQNIYLGALPDDLSHRLLRFIASGNTYDAYVKNISQNGVTVFVRELTRGKRYRHIPSFQVVSTNHLPHHPTPVEDRPALVMEDEEVAAAE